MTTTFAPAATITRDGRFTLDINREPFEQRWLFELCDVAVKFELSVDRAIPLAARRLIPVADLCAAIDAADGEGWRVPCKLRLPFEAVAARWAGLTGPDRQALAGRTLRLPTLRESYEVRDLRI